MVVEFTNKQLSDININDNILILNELEQRIKKYFGSITWTAMVAYIKSSNINLENVKELVDVLKEFLGDAYKLVLQDESHVSFFRNAI